MVYALRDVNKGLTTFFHSNNHEAIGSHSSRYSDASKITLGQGYGQIEIEIKDLPYEDDANAKRIAQHADVIEQLDQQVQQREAYLPHIDYKPQQALPGYDIVLRNLGNMIYSTASIIDCVRPYEKGAKAGMEEINDYSRVTQNTIESLFKGQLPDAEKYISQLADDTGADKGRFFLMFALAGARNIYESRNIYNDTDAGHEPSRVFAEDLQRIWERAQSALIRNGVPTPEAKKKRDFVEVSITQLTEQFTEALRETYKPFEPQYRQQSCALVNFEKLVDAALRHHSPADSYHSKLTELKQLVPLAYKAVTGAANCLRHAEDYECYTARKAALGSAPRA